MRQAQAGRARKNDGRQFERAVWRNKTPKVNRHAVLLAGHADHAQHHSVVEKRKKRKRAKSDPSRKSDKAN